MPDGPKKEVGQPHAGPSEDAALRLCVMILPQSPKAAALNNVVR